MNVFMCVGFFTNMKTFNSYTQAEIDATFKVLRLETPEQRQSFNFGFSPVISQVVFEVTVSANPPNASPEIVSRDA